MNWRPTPELDEYDPKCAIYELIDPETGQTRYVGQGVDPQARFRDHLRCSHNPDVQDWVFGLQKKGKQPTCKVLQHCRTFRDADEAERHWITIRRNEKHPLLNKALGGRGVPMSKVAASTPTEWVHVAYCLKYAKYALQEASEVLFRSLPKRHSLPQGASSQAEKVDKLLGELEAVLTMEMPGWTGPWRIATGSAEDHFEKIDRIKPDGSLAANQPTSHTAHPSLAPDGGPPR